MIFLIEQDTVKLLRECDSGIKMGIKSIDDVLDNVKSKELKDALEGCKSEHLKMQNDIKILLDKCHDDGKNPNPIAEGMSWMKTGVMLTFDESDNTVADLMTDGCNMGVKSLTRYLNKYKAASEDAKTLAKRLISSEEQLAIRIRKFL